MPHTSTPQDAPKYTPDQLKSEILPQLLGQPANDMSPEEWQSIKTACDQLLKYRKYDNLYEKAYYENLSIFAGNMYLKLMMTL